MNQFPETLKTWRKARRLSQLDLALEADVSSRHISFLETGRAKPSREMIVRLGDAMSLPLATRNQMLTNAGFAARYPGRDWDAEEMAPIRSAVEYTLDRHSPYPAIAIDRLWTIVRMNKTAEMLFGMLAVSEGDSLLDLLLSEHVPPLIENWPEVAHHTAQRLRTESAAQGGIAIFDKTADHLSDTRLQHAETFNPVVPTVYKAGDLRLSLFSTIAQFGTPVDLTLDDLKIELFFPADKAPEDLLKGMAAQ